MRPRHVIPLLATVLWLGGCGTAAGSRAGPPSGPPSSASPVVTSTAQIFGGTDRVWLEINIVMNEELLPLLDLSPTRSRNEQVKQLAADAAATTRTELAALYQLHAAAGLPSKNPHRGMPMPGMVTPKQVAEAAAASGPAFDRLLRKHLAAHLEQGLRLATGEAETGMEQRTKALAAEMVTSRRNLTDRMRRLGR